MNIKSKIRAIPDYPIKGIMFRDISTLLSDPQGLNEVITQLIEIYGKDKYDFIPQENIKQFVTEINIGQ